MELTRGSEENLALEFAQSKFFLTDVSCRGMEASQSLFLINKGPSRRAREARVPGESATAEIQYGLFLESPGAGKRWGHWFLRPAPFSPNCSTSPNSRPTRRDALKPPPLPLP